MTSTAQKWLIGCGAGCGLVVLLIALVIGGGVWFVRGLKDRFESAATQGTELATKFGEVEDWTPPVDGAVPAARLAAFLTVRDSLTVPRERFAETFDAFERVDRHETKPRLNDVLRAVRGGMSLAPLIGEFYSRRNSALNAVEMGLGEYSYIYVIAYYGYLGKSPDDGPRNLHSDGGERGRDLRPRLHRQLLAMLRHQLAAAQAAADISPAWRDTLAAEIARLADDDRRLPWAGGLPPAIAASLAGSRDRIEATWSSACNAFELAEPKGDHANFSIEN